MNHNTATNDRNQVEYRLFPAKHELQHAPVLNHYS
jgi:hypothetical protein